MIPQNNDRSKQSQFVLDLAYFTRYICDEFSSVFASFSSKNFNSYEYLIFLKKFNTTGKINQIIEDNQWDEFDVCAYIQFCHEVFYGAPKWTSLYGDSTRSQVFLRGKNVTATSADEIFTDHNVDNGLRIYLEDGYTCIFVMRNWHGRTIWLVISTRDSVIKFNDYQDSGIGSSEIEPDNWRKKDWGTIPTLEKLLEHIEDWDCGDSDGSEEYPYDEQDLLEEWLEEQLVLSLYDEDAVLASLYG